MKIIEEKIIVENGQEYKLKTYSNGTTVKEMVSAPAKPKEKEPTESELAQAEMLLMQTEIIANQNAQDEVLAEILLNQIGG